jgi:hypothetical protein
LSHEVHVVGVRSTKRAEDDGIQVNCIAALDEVVFNVLIFIDLLLSSEVEAVGAVLVGDCQINDGDGLLVVVSDD